MQWQLLYHPVGQVIPVPIVAYVLFTHSSFSSQVCNFTWQQRVGYMTIAQAGPITNLNVNRIQLLQRLGFPDVVQWDVAVVAV